MRRLSIILTILALGAAGGGAAYFTLPGETLPQAQSEVPGASAQPAKAQTVDINSLHPGLRLGIRANFVQRQLNVLPTVVLVPDEASYLAAISAWRTDAKGGLRFPVLIDDATFASQRRIMRFVRAFGPKSVVRWKSDGKPLPANAEERRIAIEHAAAAAWGAKSVQELAERWKAGKFEPSGAIVAWPEDPAWTAALALAAGRGQPLIWAKPGHTGPSSDLDIKFADELSASIMSALDATGYSYKKLGGSDAIDAITLCLNLPVKVSFPLEKRDMLATTDVIGRETSEPRKARWAFASQIFGDAPTAAYDAMCGLFLVPDRAWLFDGYDSTQPWVLWDMTKTGENLAPAGIASTVDDGPNGMGLSTLQFRGAGVRMGDETQTRAPGMGVDAGFIAFNTSGNADFFDLKPGQAKPIDIPILRRPAMVYFVHSWSANAPAQRNTVAGVWLERGTYAYIGSVHEPFLQRFVPTPIVATRLAAGFAWGAAPRFDDDTAWKIAVIGDPLITIGPAGPRVEPELPLKGAEDVNDSIPDLLKASRFADGLRALALVGRDADAGRLVRGLAKDDPKNLSLDAAVAGIASCFAAGDFAAFLAAAKSAAPALDDPKRVEFAGLAEIRDMVWHAVWPGLTRADGEEADLLASCLRPEVLARDAGDAMGAMRRARGEDAARRVLEKARLMVKDRATSDQLDKLAR